MMFLTREEIQELTNKKRMSSQVAVLDSLGIVYKLRPDGSPVVLKAHVEQLLGGGHVAEQQPKSTWEPNWTALAEQEAESAARRKAQREAKRERTNAERKRRGLESLP